MSRCLAPIVLLLMLAACSSGPESPGSIDTGTGGAVADQDKVELEALRRIGDVRVYYYQKPGMKPSALHKGQNVEQKRQLHVMVNKGHSYYAGIPDYKMKAEEIFLYDSDMHDLLVVLRDQMGFFDKGASVNIKGDDPVRRADREDTTDRMIAVEQIKDGKVNTSYFYRRVLEEALDADRSEKFNKCQAIVTMAVGRAIPRGKVGDNYDEGKTLQPRRGN